MSDKRKQKKAQRRKKRKGKEKKGKNQGAARWMNSDLPFHGAWINQDWQSSSMAYILVARKLSSGLMVFSIFYVNTTKGEIEECMGHSHITEDSLRRDFIDLEDPSAPSFFKVDLDLVKEILAKAIQATKEREEQLPENCSMFLKLLGPLDFKKSEEELEKEDNPYAVRFYYNTENLGELENDIRLIPDFEETEDSNEQKRRFFWMQSASKGIFKRESLKRKQAVIVIANEQLHMDVVDEYKGDSLNEKLIQLLGSGVEFKERKELTGE